VQWRTPKPQAHSGVIKTSRLTLQIVKRRQRKFKITGLTMNERLTAFSTEELSALVFTMDIAATVEPLTPEAAKIQQELVAELEERDSTG
jgi:hypothetical protein